MANGDVKVGAAAPAGITLPANVLLHDVQERREEVDVESLNKSGQFYGGKTKRTKVIFALSGECLEGGEAGLRALQNTGSGTAAAPRIGKMNIGDNHENQSSWSFEAWYFDNTQSGYLSGTAGP